VQPVCSGYSCGSIPSGQPYVTTNFGYEKWIN
jgi:hypothetical protein